MVKCPICETGELQKGKTKEEMHGVYLGEYPAEVCESCGESFVNSDAMRRIERKAKKKEIWEIRKKIRTEAEMAEELLKLSMQKGYLTSEKELAEALKIKS